MAYDHKQLHEMLDEILKSKLDHEKDQVARAILKSHKELPKPEPQLKPGERVPLAPPRKKWRPGTYGKPVKHDDSP